MTWEVGLKPNMRRRSQKTLDNIIKPEKKSSSHRWPIFPVRVENAKQFQKLINETRTTKRTQLFALNPQIEHLLTIVSIDFKYYISGDRKNASVFAYIPGSTDSHYILAKFSNNQMTEIQGSLLQSNKTETDQTRLPARDNQNVNIIIPTGSYTVDDTQKTKALKQLDSDFNGMQGIKAFY